MQQSPDDKGHGEIAQFGRSDKCGNRQRIAHHTQNADDNHQTADGNS